MGVVDTATPFFWLFGFKKSIACLRPIYSVFYRMVQRLADFT